MPYEAGKVLKGPPNSGIFVFPDNSSEGTLEKVLLNCAKRVYPNLLAGAETLVAELNLDRLSKEDKRDLIKASGKDKVTVGCVGNVLRPGKAIQVSIQDNKWVSRRTLNLPEVVTFNDFLKGLFNLV